MDTLQLQVEKLMRENKREAGTYTYTVPSPDLYPFQWLWDSCFHAIILSHFDIEQAKAELRSVCSHPLINGLLPHIIYWNHEQTTSANWGREMRGDVINAAWGVVGTSAITQPPIMGLAAWRIYEKDHDAEFLVSIYEPLASHYKRLLEDRTLEDSPLSFIVNPDESGEDNSPRFDNAQNLPPMHTALESLERRIDRMRENALCNFMARTCMSKYFAIIDVPFNIILAESLEYLAQIAEVLGHTEDKELFHVASANINDAIKTTLCNGGICSSYDPNSKTFIETKTWAMFMPLYGGLLSKEDADELVQKWLLDPEQFWTEFPVPSTSLLESSFDAHDGFWRGPVWMAPNWFIYKGLKRYGYEKEAQQVRDKTVALIERSGFREQYDPHTGEGIGAHNFTWGGLVIDMK